jgi:predicted RNA-binding Zn ribbon-like protein
VSSPEPPPTSPAFALVLQGEPVAVRLMNTIWADRHGVHDALCGTDDLRRWLSSVEGVDGVDGPWDTVQPDDVANFRLLRDALRRLAALVTEDTRPAAASATGEVARAVTDVNHAVTKASRWPQLSFRDGELHREHTGTATAPARSLSAIAARGIDLLAGADRVPLRACYAPSCVLYFVKDHPRREWCSTACGNRARAARHYHRHRD